jgi:hypothetical protein
VQYPVPHLVAHVVTQPAALVEHRLGASSMRTRMCPG